MVEELGRHRYGFSLERAHTLLTNVGQFNDKPAGHTCFVVAGDPLDHPGSGENAKRWQESHRTWLSSFECDSLSYARVNRTDQAGGDEWCWTDARSDSITLNSASAVTALFLDGAPLGARASGLQLRCELRKTLGREAVNRARTFIVDKNNKVSLLRFR